MSKKTLINKIAIVTAIVSIFTTSTFAAEPALTNYAGSGEVGYEDGKKLEATFGYPYGIALDKDGSLIVVDNYNNLIRRVSGDKVSIIAGATDTLDSQDFPMRGYADGLAEKARFNKPRFAAVDSKGSIFITDTGNNSIRKIAGGKVYTFAGAGMVGYKDGKGAEARFDTPSGIAVDKDDNLYIADSLNHAVRKITPSGEVTTLAGKYPCEAGYKDGPASEALFNEPSDLAVDKNGAVYVVDSGNQLIRKIEKGVVSTVAGVRTKVAKDTGYAKGGIKNGPAKEAMFNFPKGLFVTDEGTIIIADTWNQRIRAIKKDGSTVTLAGSGEPGKKDSPLAEAMLNTPVDVLYSSGSLYVSDMMNNCIRAMPLDLKKPNVVADRAELMEGIDFGKPTDEIQVWVDRKKVDFPDIKPYINNDRTYVPFRFICEAWGAEVKFLGKEGGVEITKGSITKKVTFDNDNLVLKDGRSMIKIKHLADIMESNIEWIAEYRAVIVSTQK